MRDRLNLTLPVEMITRINELSERKKIPRSAISSQSQTITNMHCTPGVPHFLMTDHAMVPCTSQGL